MLASSFGTKIEDWLNDLGGDDEIALFDVFTVYKLWCRDLTGDGQAEMVVYMICCTVSSPDPVAIFTRHDDGSWRYAWGKPLEHLWKVKLSGRTLKVTVPVYRSSDANCCPSSFRHFTVRWNGKRFVRR